MKMVEKKKKNKKKKNNKSCNNTAIARTRTRSVYLFLESMLQYFSVNFEHRRSKPFTKNGTSLQLEKKTLTNIKNRYSLEQQKYLFFDLIKYSFNSYILLGAEFSYFI